MKRNLGLERVFKLGDFKSMRITSDILDIPEELALDEEFATQARLLQLTEVDRAFYQYRLQAGNLNEFETDKERLDSLVEQETQIFANIKARIQAVVLDTDTAELVQSTEEE